MHAPTKLSDLVEDIYSAGLEPARWNDVVVGINAFVGGRATGIYSKDPISKSAVTHYFCNADPHYIKLYSETYSKLGPNSPLPSFGRIVCLSDVVEPDEFHRGRFYQEWMRPQGCVDIAEAVLEKSNADSKIRLAVHAGNRIVDDAMRRRIAQVAPHAHRALMINRTIDRTESETASFADTLDSLGARIFMVDADCRIVHVNTSAHNMLCEDDCLRAVGGRLVVRDAEANHGLHRTVAGGAAAVAANREAFLLTAHDGARYMVHLLPLRSLVRSGIQAPQNVAAAVFVRKVEMNDQSWGGTIARTFGLTPAELRVLLAIVDIGGVPESSRKLGIAETTVKTHLARVFSKTGASRQTDLVKLAAGFSFPLAD